MRKTEIAEQCAYLSGALLSVQVLAARAYSACYIGMFGEDGHTDVVEQVQGLLKCHGPDRPDDIEFLIGEIASELARLKKIVRRNAQARRRKAVQQPPERG